MMTARWLLMLFITIVSQITAIPQSLYPGERTHWNRGRGYAPFQHATPDGIVITDTTSLPLSDSYRLSKPTASFTLRFNVVNANNHPAKSYQFFDSHGNKRKIKNPAWGFFIKGDCGDSLIFMIKTVEEFDALSSEAAVSISAKSSESKHRSVTIKDGIDCHTGKNNWLLSVKDGEAILSCGNHSVNQMLTIPVNFNEAMEFGFTACSGASISVCDITFSDNTPERNRTQWSNPDHLANYLSASQDSLEGYWTVFDRSLEESLLLLGGNYNLALVKEGYYYLLIYLGGAIINSDFWQPGMVKARLKPTAFSGIFDVEWIDSQGLIISNAVKAQSGDGETITIQFPYHSSTLRLRKLPPSEEFIPSERTGMNSVAAN